MMSRLLFLAAHQAVNRKFHGCYRRLQEQQWLSAEEHREQQEADLRQAIAYAGQQIPYYRRLFAEYGLQPGDINRLADLARLPVLDRATVRSQAEAFRPANLAAMKYHTFATGGSTGTPLAYNLSADDRMLSGALLYRGWGYGGYQLADRMVFIGGASLDIGSSSWLQTRIQETVRSIRKLSSFDMGDAEMERYVQVINRFRPKFFRGYATSIYFFARWCRERGERMHQPEAVFTTAEKLYPEMRELIAGTWECEVYDTYGMNDGGASAYECPCHQGLHIDTERAVLEIVDDQGRPVSSGEGRVIVTSLHNRAMPFIRYDTGDRAVATERTCACGRSYRLLQEVVGRSVDMLFTPEGKMVHGWYFLYLFWRYPRGVRQYQVIQEELDRIVIEIVPDPDFDPGQFEAIRKLVKQRSEGWRLEFRLVERIERSAAGKYKFIVNRLLSP